MLGFVLILFAATSILTPSRADTTSASGATEITSLPYQINTAGVYFLSGNLSLSTTNVNAITVSADDVTLDLNGHTISNVAAGKGVIDTGIYAPGGSRLTIRNGTIRGFTYGIYLGNTAGYGDLIENMRIMDTTYAGVCIYTSGSVVRHCQMSRIGGSTQPSYPNGVGMLIIGTNSSVQDCDISELTTSSVYPTIGIYGDGAGTASFLNNRINGAQYGIYLQPGYTAKYRDNLCAASVTTPYTGGTNADNN